MLGTLGERVHRVLDRLGVICFRKRKRVAHEVKNLRFFFLRKQIAVSGKRGDR